MKRRRNFLYSLRTTENDLSLEGGVIGCHEDAGGRNG